mmetsp:Transcript_50377/g.93172  ORF Transcript_50377/g.93172 Transcript_50377/m.93172 type:complete len:309 (-) Transcript_50377:849-1775(-)
MVTKGEHLPRNRQNVRVRIELWVVLHVLQCVLIRPQDLKRLCRDGNCLPNIEVLQLEVLSSGRVLEPRLLPELACCEATISLLHLPHSNLEVGREDTYDELADLILMLVVGKLGFIPKDLTRQGHKSHQVHFSCFGRQCLAVHEGVLIQTNAIVRWVVQHEMPFGCITDIDGALTLVNAQVRFIEASGEVVAVVEDHFPAKNANGLTHNQIFRHVWILIRLQHTWICIDVVVFVELSTFEEHREAIAARVPAVCLVHLNGVVGEVVVDNEVDAHPVRSWIVPIALESQHLAIILQELNQLPVNRRLTQ